MWFMGSVKAYSINIDTQTSCCSSLRAVGVDCVVSVPFHSLHLLVQRDPSVSKSIAARKLNTHAGEGGMICIHCAWSKTLKDKISHSCVHIYKCSYVKHRILLNKFPVQHTCACSWWRRVFESVNILTLAMYLLKLTVNTLHASVHHVFNSISPATNTGRV